MKAQEDDVITIPNRFNNAFLGRGWVMYEHMDTAIAKAAVIKAEGGDLDGAEDDLVAYYTPETIRLLLAHMGDVVAFGPRMCLAQKALLDHAERRYYASAMVSIALLDGLVSDLHEKRRSFFASELDIDPMDSISTHSTDLHKLSLLLGKPRKTTRKESISIPYRHGIMHGMDLGFDNKKVAVKAWAALFAIRDWAIRTDEIKAAESRPTEEQPPLPSKPPTGERIGDIPQLRDMKSILALVKIARFAKPFVRPVLRLMGKNVEKFDQSMNQIMEMETQAGDSATVPDRFNDFFSNRGWIMYEYMNANVAKAAVLKAEAGDVDGAEDDIVAHYTPETIQFLLMSMRGVAAFAPRRDLAEKALLDYTDGRYYASVMVSIALLDGLVSELHEKRRGFFAAETDMKAVDSISANSMGLQRLSAVLGKTRTTTRGESMEVPYRHGIMHGVDLGFDNKKVAAKSWAALFAVREWAVRAEAGTLSVPKRPVNKISLRETLRDYAKSQQRNEALKKLHDEWKPRNIVLTPPISSLDSPEEQKIVEFLECWKRRNYGDMAKCLARSQLIDQNLSKTAKDIRRTYSNTKLVAYSLTSLRDFSAAMTEIDAKLCLEGPDGLADKDVTFRIAFEGIDGHLLSRFADGGCWVVNNLPFVFPL